MAGVWVFNNGVYRLESSPRRRVLVHLPSGEVVSSYSSLEQILRGLGWERYYGGDPDLYQFHKHSSIDLISLPMDFSKFTSVHMYDIVVKNPNVFHVRWGDDPKEVPEGRGEEQMGYHVKQIATLHPKPHIGAKCSNRSCHLAKEFAV
ncbi:hypothetical protein PTKIN_Ptkin03bG0168600 [Pterospermum kingtungense]